MKFKQAIFFIWALISFSCKDSKLPTLNIIPIKTIGWQEKSQCKVYYLNKNGHFELNGKIKYRGGFSAGFPKNSFSLELDSAFQFDNLPKNDDWVINANYIDKTFMRHKICYDLFKEMNKNNISSRSTYINLFINDTNKGLYLLMEEINASMIGLDKKDTMSMLFKDPPVFINEVNQETKESLNFYQQKYPEIKTKDNTVYIEKFKTFLFNSDDKDFEKEISNWVDIDNIIDWHIILLFTNNSDGLLKNFYLYKTDKNSPFKIAIWDYDHSFGRDGDNEKNFLERKIDCNKSVLFRRLIEIKSTGYTERIKKRWLYLRIQGILTEENINKHISQNDKIINKEVERNFKLWPMNSDWYHDSNNYLQEVELIQKFVKVRLFQLDDFFENL